MGKQKNYSTKTRKNENVKKYQNTFLYFKTYNFAESPNLICLLFLKNLIILWQIKGFLLLFELLD